MNVTKQVADSEQDLVFNATGFSVAELIQHYHDNKPPVPAVSAAPADVPSEVQSGQHLEMSVGVLDDYSNAPDPEDLAMGTEMGYCCIPDETFPRALK